MDESKKRRSAEGTRKAILAAARRSFAENGFERTTIRGVARTAGFDPALIVRYFGNKQALFVEAVELPLEKIETAPAGSKPDLARLITTFIETWHGDLTFLGLLRASATQSEAADTMRAFFELRVRDRLAALTGGSAEQATLLGSMLIGLAWGREIIGLEGLNALTPREIAQAVSESLAGPAQAKL